MRRFRLVARAAAKDQLEAEAATFRAIDMDVGVTVEMAHQQTATHLPAPMLSGSLSTIHHMEPAQRREFIDYSVAVMRYNGRVTRIIAYDAGKRAAGKEQGVERPDTEKADAVITAGKAVSHVIRSI
ncbi:hypothetical protein AB0I66_35365 [Streptomyces sp. NPDC050439]|uniref:hypothetical protein n=1 Tax=unclassified Streptomyces TaxID=2593676 RepID=UPI00341918B2